MMSGGTDMNVNNAKSRAILAMVALVAIVVLVTAGTWASGRERAAAAEIKTRCLKALKTGNSWKAKLVETETGSDGSKSVMKRDVEVRGPDAYRVTLIERDAQGRDVVSTTLRVGTTLYSRRTEADGSSVLHVTKGVPPELGVMMDNVLGQMVGSLVDSTQLKKLGQESVKGRLAHKLLTEPEHYVWVDETSGLPLREQISSGGKVNHEVDVDSIAIDAAVPADEFDSASLGTASRTESEDLGFRPTAVPRAAAPYLDFSPLGVRAPKGFSVGEQGYIDSKAATGGGSYVASFVRGTHGLLVTQVRRDGLGGEVKASDGSEAGSDGSEVVSIGGRSALYFADRTAPRLQFAVGDVLLTIEGPVSLQDMVRVAENVQ